MMWAPAGDVGREDNMGASVEDHDIVAGLRALGCTTESAVIVHASLRSFGHVRGGAVAVCRALTTACGTVLMPGGSYDRTGLPAPPGLQRADNAARVSRTWPEFDAALARAVPYADDLPIDAE